jgi:uracil-DNA glycosylase family 4
MATATLKLPSKAEGARCWECPLLENRVCHTHGPTGAKVAFVSRSPGKHDVRADKPFAGPSGKVLDHLLKKHGVSRDEILTTNVVLCQTDDPPLSAIKACRPRLEAEIANCELLIAGGAEATAALTKYRAVHRARGFSINRGTQRVVVTNNPAAVIRDNDKYPDMVADFRRAFDPLPPPVFPEVRIIWNEFEARDILTKWLRTDFDYLSSDLEFFGPTITCAGFSRDGRKAVVFDGRVIREGTNRKLLQRFYERSDIKFVWHNGKADTKVLRQNNIAGRVDEDTFLMSYALDERPGYHALEYLLSSELGWPDYEPESVKYFKKTGEFKKPENRSRQELYKYNGWDSAGTAQLKNLLDPKLDSDNVRELYSRLVSAAERFTTVELNGFHFDVEEACNINERTAIPLLWGLEEELRRISGRYLLNPRSVPQMKAIYYQQFGLKHNLRDSGKKKLKFSTGREVREEIEGGRFDCKPAFKTALVEFAATHRRYAKITKVRSSFIEGLSKRVTKDGRLFCNFNVGGTSTGRTSSSEPNFQNIIREEVESIPGIRTLFLPSRDHVIISADYSQAELRTCAKLSGDKNLLSIYRDSSRSLHKERASAFYGANFSKEEYVKSKNINFGVTYGQSAAAFAQMYHMPEVEAQAYIDSWWREFPQLREWTRNVWATAKEHGFVQSPFGHKRRIHLITEENVGGLQREMVNFLPQNIAAWLTISSIIDLIDNNIRVVATVHDSIIIDCPSHRVDGTIRTVKSVMERQAVKQLGWFDIPFAVDISIGSTWGTLEEVAA